MSDIKMSLDALLEAAQYIERSNHPDAKARGRSAHGEEPSQNALLKSPSDTKEAQSSPGVCSNDSQKESNDTSKKSETDEEDPSAKGHWRRAGGAGLRETHNKLEKNRRAHLKECFDNLRLQIPNLEDKKTSNLNILRQALRYIQFQRRREKEFEQELQRLAQAKILLQLKYASLESELNNMQIDISSFLKSGAEGDTHSVSTATADDSPIMSEDEDDHCSTPLKIMTEEDTLSSSEALMAAPTPAEFTMASNLEPKPVQPTTFTDIKIVTDKATMSKVILPVTIQDVKSPVLAKALSQTVVPKTVLNAGQKVAISMPSSMPVPITMAPPAKPLVARILHQAITERQRLQKQQQQVFLQQQQQQEQVVIQKHNEQLMQLQQQQLAGLMSQPQVLAVNTAGVRVATTTTPKTSTVTPLRPTVSFSHLLPSVVPAASIIAHAAQINPSSQSPALTTGLPSSHQPSLIRLGIPTSRAGSTIVTTIPVGSAVGSTSGATTATVAIAPVPSSTCPGSSGISSSHTVNLNNVKHIINSPITALNTAQLVAPAAQISALQHILAQSVGRTGLSTTSSPLTMTPIISVSQAQLLNMTSPAAQLVSPMAVISPAAGQVPLGTTLNQAQLIKAHVGNIPILSPYTLPMKPVVMVTVPSGVSATGASTAQPSIVTISNAS